jgi:alkylated DNA repair dioxygenase AlkB
MTRSQLSLFAAPPNLPPGFRYQSEALSREQEHDFLRIARELPFKEFEFHGYLGRRRIVPYGWRYDFAEEKIQRANAIPAFLLPFREIAARFGGIPPSRLQQALVTEYGAGAPIGWHRDKDVYGDVIGISLASPCTLRLRRKAGKRWERASIIAEPRSIYLLHGPSRDVWEHSIPPVDALRYSVTFRTFRDSSAADITDVAAAAVNQAAQAG